jgi:hypothetical protein
MGEGKKIAAGVWISANILGQEMLYTDSFMISDFM